MLVSYITLAAYLPKFGVRAAALKKRASEDVLDRRRRCEPT